MLSKKLLRDGEKAEAAASAASGITIEAVNAAAVSPVIAFSFKEAWTWSAALDDFEFTNSVFFVGFNGNAVEIGDWRSFWLADVNGIAIETEAIFWDFSSCFLLFSVSKFYWVG